MGKVTLLGASALQSAVFVGALIVAQPAMAQATSTPPAATTTPPTVATEGQQANEAAQAAEDAANPSAVAQPVARDVDGSDSSGTITVTGSRIKLPNLDSIEPTTTVDYRQVRERNFTNVADALNELPQIRGSVTPAGAQGSFGQGTNFVNTYGLGSNRTLTLINGRRFVSSNPATNFGNASSGTQVDLNIVPDILLDRIDIVSIGGAPVYGSDAIAGVVNVILRTKFKGIEANVTSGITEEGDNFRYNVSGLVGHDFFDGRLNLTGSVSHDQVTGLVYNSRDFLRKNIGGVTNPTLAQATASRTGTISNNDGRLNTDIGFNNSTTDGFPGTVLARDVGIPFLSSGGVITATNLACNAANRAINPASCFGLASPAALAFAPDGSLIPLNQGTLFGANTSASGLGGDGTGVFQFNNFSQITSDLRRTIVDGFATFEVTPQIDFFVEAKHYRSRADELVQQPTFNSSLFGGTSGALTFRTSNPFVSDSARALLTSRGVTQFSISRASTDFADLTGFNETRINRGVAGFRGDFGLFGREMNFEATVNYGKAKSKDIGQDINAQNFVNAVNVTTVNGQIVCTTAPTVGTTGFASGGLAPIADANCVPLNPLGFGRATQAARDYVIEDVVTKSAQRQIVANVNVGGTFFDLPGGGAAFNVGYEHREEKAVFTPSDFQQAGRGRSVAIVPLSGKYNLDEVFGEVLLPIISADNDIPFVSGLQVFGRGRYVDNTVNGGFFSYAAGGSYAPIKDIEFRGNYTRSFRSPAITELFLPVVNAFSTVPDICSLGTRNGGAVPLIRARNCAAFLAAFPNATPDTAATATVPIQTGGNVNLENEKADSYTVGVILRPRFIPRLSMTADFVSITLKQPIASLTVAQVAGACFDNESFNASDPANGNSFCSLIRRDANGKVIVDPANPAVKVGFVNGVEIAYRGVQGTVNYSVPLSGIGLPGSFSLGADALFTKYRQNNITGVAPARSDGILGDPAFAGQLRLRYANKFWGVNTTVNYTGEQLFNRLNREVGVAGSGPDAREIDKLDDYAVVSSGLFFDPSDKFRLTLSVTNLFNKQGQKYQGELIPASYIDLLGRRYAASARVRF
jgi:outer membrane receptor protein involved in Fe transport